jgi:hypothetical protein
VRTDVCVVPRNLRRTLVSAMSCARARSRTIEPVTMLPAMKEVAGRTSAKGMSSGADGEEGAMALL